MRWVIRLLSILMMLAGLIVVASAVSSLLAGPAECYGCVRTFCGSSAECARGCHCFIPNDWATGHCG